jgi:hypothetical protein
MSVGTPKTSGRFVRMRRKVAEQVTAVWNYRPSLTGLRNQMRKVGIHFWSQERDPFYQTQINYLQARCLYRNEGEWSLGSAFCKPIVDLSVGFMGLPVASSEDEAETQFLNECLHDFWAAKIQEMFTAAIRDSKTVVRVVQPDLFDPLMTLEEQEHCALEIYPPEIVEIERSLTNKRIIERAIITHRLTVIEDKGNPRTGQDPTVREIDVLEVITRDSFSFFNKTDNVEMPELGSANRWKFVPLVEVYNEWDSALQGGQSDLETPLPFVKAFHDLLVQGLQAHKYHSTPKVKFKAQDIYQFIKNNYPEAWDETTGMLKPQAEINWRGREILLLQTEEDVAFLEAKSVLGDTKILAEFLIDCICIAAQTPEWAFMRVDSGSANSDRNAQTVPLVKKISRKRNDFMPYVQDLCKMVLVISGSIPTRPSISWEVIRADDQVVSMQALQQMVMALEVARQGQLISDQTYREMLASFLPAMKSPTQEEKDAQKNATGILPPQQFTSQNGNPGQPQLSAGPQGRNE